MESLEGRLLLDGQASDISLHVPAKMYEGKAVVIPTTQPADYWQRIRYWDIDWGDGVTTTKWRGNTPLQHIYTLFGMYPAEATGTRRNGEVVTFDFVADVQNVRPAPKIVAFAAAVPNQPVTINFNPGDSAPRDTLVVSWTLYTPVAQLSLPYTPASVSEAQSLTYTFTAPGKYKVTLATRDSGGLVGKTTKTITIAPVVEQPDVANASLTNLVVGGTNGDDVITFQDRWSAVEVFMNGHSYGVFSVSGKLIAYGGPGNDQIAADATIDNDVVFYGGAGNDTLAGGSGTNQLFGGSGTNKIIEPGL
ncbi:MAG: hypothetical protein ABSH20_10320 [Tepidisphaeraceae bacterium]|jgi:PKD repeat protein